MKRITYLLLVVVLVQVTGAGSLCAPPAGASHDCCNPTPTTPAPAPASLPDCCLVAVPQEQNFATPQRGADNLVPTNLQPEVAVISAIALSLALSPRFSRALDGLTPPPLSPLRQSCQILI